MALSGKQYPLGLVMFVSVLVLFASAVTAVDWSSSASSTIGSSASMASELLLSGGGSNKDQFGEMMMESSAVMRRMLANSPFFISYGSLSADRIPCPAGSGRSYYTNKCYASAGPVRPYNRGCSAITHCARS